VLGIGIASHTLRSQPMHSRWSKGDAAGIAGAKLAIVPECGHAPSIEKPEEFLAAVLPFID
jgi:pimeloyl-ACP methyl ester carboxylesterase